ncbi:MAG: hypothetical protein HYU39_06825, partial [Thaumarchaeota archaeon]|nr:hypothetical protein [Nitrososphaerota archaeon]
MDESPSPVVKKAIAQIEVKLASIKKIKEFVFEDLDKTIALSRITKSGSSEAYGAPNFMIALALCCYTESWGKLMIGVPEGPSLDGFNTLLERMGADYGKLIKDNRKRIYDELRGSLVHSYIGSRSKKSPTIPNINVCLEGGTCGIEYDGCKYTVFV